jgi:hypothetical protein
LSKSYHYHTAETSEYRNIFESLPNQDEKLSRAEQALNSRLSGVIDMATAYMKLSAYTFTDTHVPDVRGAVVVFMHDFYDSPHIYPNLVFPDFWTWIECTIHTLREAEIPFWIKPHPNQISLSSKALKELCFAHPDVRLLSEKISNVQLAQAGILCGVTVYGTVAHELAFLGIHTIACAQHPHNAFQFCRTANTKSDYISMLKKPEFSPLPLAEKKRQALAFYYMHNLYGDKDTLETRAQFIELWKLSNINGSSASDFCIKLDALRDLPGWRAHINKLTMEIKKNEI